MKKLIVLLSALVLVAGTLVLGGMDVAHAADPTVTGTAVTDLGIGELRTLPVVTATDTDGATIDAATDLYVQIPTAVHAVFDTTVAGTVTKTGAFVVDATVTFTDPKIAKVNVTVNGGAGDTIIITGLKILGYGSASTALPLTFSIDGGTVYADANVNTDVTVIDDSTHNVLTGAALAVSNAVFGSASTYTIDFTLPAGTTIPKDGVISLSFPGSDVTGATLITHTGLDGTFALTNVGSILTLTRQDDGTNAAPGAIQLVIPLVVNGVATDVATIVIITGTTAGVTTQSLATVTTPAVTINPVNIDNLRCLGSSAPGNVYLGWTVPLGATGGYVAHYSTGDMTTDGLFNGATNFAGAAAWGNGIVGSSIGAQLITGLSAGGTYFFNVKAKGVGTSLSALSNVGVICAAGSSAASSTVPSTPVSIISSPVDESSLPAEETVIIEGSSSDNATSSIRQIEVSTDGGATWALAVPTVSNSDNGFDWTYSWTAPAEGPHLLQTRATDWAGVVETPSAGITVTVAPKPGIIYLQPGETAPGETPADETPADETPADETPAEEGTPAEEPTVAEMEAFQTVLSDIKEQLVILLNQVLAMLRALLLTY